MHLNRKCVAHRHSPEHLSTMALHMTSLIKQPNIGIKGRNPVKAAHRLCGQIVMKNPSDFIRISLTHVYDLIPWLNQT